MKKTQLIMCVLAVAAIAMTSCKPKESAYKAAYEKAQEKPVNEEVQESKPVMTAQTKPETLAAGDRAERLTGVNGSQVNTFNVVVGSFLNQTNATALQESLIKDGYNAIIAQNEKGSYRVIAASFNDRQSATNARESIKAKYPNRFNDAWLLINQ